MKSRVRMLFLLRKNCWYFYPGDIVGLHDTGNFKIGDTLTEGEQMNFKESQVSHQSILDTLTTLIL